MFGVRLLSPVLHLRSVENVTLPLHYSLYDYVMYSEVPG